MAEITASLVKELREMTGAGMMECKKALVEVDGDLEKAVDVLRTHGLAAAAKKAGRATNEGLVVVLISEDGTTGAMAEVNCETDFVSRNEVFSGYATRIVKAVLESDPADLEALKKASVDGETVEAILTDAIHVIGENIQVSRFVYRNQPAGALSWYIHGGGRIGILVEFAFTNPATASSDSFKALAKDIAMQVAAANPGAVSREDFAPEVIEREMAIYKAQAAESGKPEQIQEKMAAGRLEKFYKESALVEQAYIKNPDKTVRAFIEEVAKEVGDTIRVVGFDRFELGQG
jgi:elongation factor Ts